MGEDFAALAKEKSVDATAEDGGYMGKVDPAALRPELREALKGITPGQITGVIKVPTGFAIVKSFTPRPIRAATKMPILRVFSPWSPPEPSATRRMWVERTKLTWRFEACPSRKAGTRTWPACVRYARNRFPS